MSLGSLEHLDDVETAQAMSGREATATHWTTPIMDRQMVELTVGLAEWSDGLG